MMLVRSFLFLLLVVGVAQAKYEDATLLDYTDYLGHRPSGNRADVIKGISFEMEIDSKIFPNFIRKFTDIPEMSKLVDWRCFPSHWIGLWADQYLEMNFAAFDNLPDDIKNQLAEGTEKVKLDLAPEDNKFSLVDRDGKPLNKGGVVKVGDESIEKGRGIYKGAGGVQSTELEKGYVATESGIIRSKSEMQITSAQKRRETILKRWLELPLEQRISLMRFADMPALAQSQILLASRDSETVIFSGLDIVLKKDSQDHLLKFMQFEWDGRTPEVKLKGYFKTIEEVTSYMRELAISLGGLASLNHPLQNQLLAIHYHISFENYAYGEKAADAVMMHYKYYNMVENYLAGQTDIIESPYSMNSYFQAFGNRGNVRKVGYLHYEFRESIRPAGEILEEIEHVMALSPKDAHELLNQKIKKIAANTTLTQLGALQIAAHYFMSYNYIYHKVLVGEVTNDPSNLLLLFEDKVNFAPILAKIDNLDLNDIPNLLEERGINGDSDFIIKSFETIKKNIQITREMEPAGESSIHGENLSQMLLQVIAGEYVTELVEQQNCWRSILNDSLFDNISGQIDPRQGL